VARWAAAIGLVASAVMVTACTSTGTRSPWWQQTGASACGPPALMRVAGQVTWLGNCAASFVIPAAKVTVHVGQDIDVHMLEESAGYSGNHLVPVWPLPYSSRPSVLARTTISSDKATGTFTARRPGRAMLFTTADCWAVARSQQMTRGKCPALDITVLP
jgi:hypothetical protein